MWDAVESTVAGGSSIARELTANAYFYLSAESKMIFFDIGNTIEDESIAVAWRSELAASILSTSGVLITKEEVQKELSISSAQRVSSVFKATIERLSPNEVVHEKILKECAWRKDLLKLRNDSARVIANLSRSHKLGIIANQSAGAHERFSRYGLLDYFSVLVSSHDAGVSKPNPKIFEIALDRSGAKPENCLMVGDRLDNDIGPAKRMGFKTVRILGCYNDSQSPLDDSEIPDFTISNLSELEIIFANKSCLTTSASAPSGTSRDSLAL